MVFLLGITLSLSLYIYDTINKTEMFYIKIIIIKKMISKKGFTLIELLVVIAIIGVLSSFVLASLSTARSRGANTAVKANLSGIRANAEIQYITVGGCYTDTGACNATTPAAFTAAACPVTGTGNIFRFASIATQIAAADLAGGFTACTSTAGGTAWAVVGQYRSDITKAWCVDSTGKSKEVTVGTAAGGQADVTAEVAAGACVE